MCPKQAILAHLDAIGLSRERLPELRTAHELATQYVLTPPHPEVEEGDEGGQGAACHSSLSAAHACKAPCMFCHAAELSPAVDAGVEQEGGTYGGRLCSTSFAWHWKPLTAFASHAAELLP